MVGEKGIEPPRIAAQDPKSSASTNFATRPQFSIHNQAGNPVDYINLHQKKYLVKKKYIKKTPFRGVILFIGREG